MNTINLGEYRIGTINGATAKAREILGIAAAAFDVRRVTFVFNGFTYVLEVGQTLEQAHASVRKQETYFREVNS